MDLITYPQAEATVAYLKATFGACNFQELTIVRDRVLGFAVYAFVFSSNLYHQLPAWYNGCPVRTRWCPY